MLTVKVGETISLAVDISNNKIWYSRNDSPWINRRSRRAKGVRKHIRRLKAAGQFKGMKFIWNVMP